MTRYQGFLLYYYYYHYYYYYYYYWNYLYTDFVRSKHAWPYLGNFLLGLSVNNTKMCQVFWNK